MNYLQPYEPASSSPTYDYTIPLGDQTYRLRLRWDQRSESWYLSLSTAADVLLLDGLRMVIGFPLLHQFQHNDKPDGELVLVDTESTGVEAALADLGWRCKLVWIPRDEFPVTTAADLGVTIS
ncbi:MAG: hypothetical protein WCS88_04135 [Patescibacteria group bacterium]|jgi:hypothetical protein